MLRLLDFELPFEVHTNASDRALGGVLVQEGHPIAFESKKLKEVEQRYSAHEKEMIAVVHCLEIWKHYLLGIKFVVVIDNVSNTYFKTQKKLLLSRHSGSNFWLSLITAGCIDQGVRIMLLML